MPEPAPFVSVVVIAGDDPKLLTLTLESLRRQSVSPEVVVVDGGGGGETDSIALQTGVPARFYRVSFPTAAEAWNHGVRQTGGEYVCLLEAGQQLPPAYLEECLFLLETSASEICLPWSGSPEWEDILSRDLSGGAGVLSRRAWNCTAGCDPSLPAGMARWELAVRMMYSGAQGCLYGEPPAGAGSCPPDAAAILHERYRWLDAGQLPFQKTASQTPRAGRLFVPAAAPGGKTVLLAMPFLTMGGSEAIVSQLCRRLKGLGFRILVVTTMPVMESQGDTTPWFEDATAAIYHLPRFLEPGLWSPFILHLLAQHSVDLLWQIGSSYVYDLLPSIKQSFPQLAVVDLLFNPVGHTANYLKYNYLIDHVVTEHEGMKQWLIERGEAKETISVIPNGVDLDRYRPEPKRDWRKPEPGGAGAFVVGYMGRLSEEKAPDTFVGIAAGLAGCDGIEFLVCGVGPMEDRLRAAVESAGLSGRVHFLGFVNSGEYLPCFDVTVVCSRLDGRPNLVMESLAMGVPVVASRVGGIPELLGDGEGGILCDAEDVPAFCSAILEWKNHPERRAEAARRARRRAEERFSLTGAGQEYASLFHRLTALAASRGGGPRPHLAVPAKRAAATRAAGSALVALRVAAMLLSPARLGLTFRNAVLWWKLRGDPAGAADIERFFDRTYYMMTYPDVAASGCPAILHYFFCGYLEDRRPSRRFNPSAYLARYPDVAASRVNPLLHFAAFGRREGRSPSA